MTSFSEEWAVADADDPSGEHTWVETSANDWDVASGEAKVITTGTQTHMRCETDLATDDHSNEAEIGSLALVAGSTLYVWCRMDSASETGYVLFFESDTGGGNGTVRLRRYNNGSSVNLAELTNQTYAAIEGDTLRLEVEGDASSTDLRGYLNDTQIISTTTTTSVITGNTRIGLGGFQLAADRISIERVDAADLGAAFDPANLQASVTADDVTLTWDSSF